MSMVHIEWGNLGRSEAIEQDLQEKAKKIFTLAPDATKLLVHLQVTNPVQSTGVATQKISLELRLPQHQDIRAESEGSDLYKCIREAKKAVLAQINSRKRLQHERAVDHLVEAAEGAEADLDVGLDDVGLDDVDYGVKA